MLYRGTKSLLWRAENRDSGGPGIPVQSVNSLLLLPPASQDSPRPIIVCFGAVDSK